MGTEGDLLGLAKEITPTSLREYAKAAGWEQVKAGIYGRNYLFRSISDSLSQLVIPMDAGEDSDDYAQLILDAASRIAMQERRLPEAVLNDLLAPNADTLRFRIATQQSDAGTLPLQDGISLLEGAKKAVLAAACSVINPATFHPRMKRAESDALLHACRLGQTERGSFIVRVSCPISAVAFSGTDRPFVRRTTTLLLRSAKRIVRAIEEDQIDSVFESTADEPVISANFCDAILQMQSAQEQASLTISAQLAKTLPETETSEFPFEVKFNSDYFETVEEIMEKLRHSTPESEAQFAATVETLNGDIGDDGSRSGEAIVIAIDGEEPTRARVILSAEDYKIADQAHMNNWLVFFSGVLERHRRLSVIKNIKNFKTLEK